MPECPQPLSARFLVGPTASGKTAIAQGIAESEGCDILSADSMLVYQGMDIGTAKPLPAERGRVRYHGMDLVRPSESFSVWDYRKHALKALSLCSAEHVETLVVGGTGLYIKSLTEGLDASPGPDPELRAHWERVVSENGLGPLREELKRSSPDLYESVRDKDNSRRLIRALEMARSGLKVKSENASRLRQETPFAGLSMPPDALKYRIELRVSEMYRRGLLAEVEFLLGSGGGFSPVAAKAIGYQEAIDVIEGRCAVDDAKKRTMSRTWQLARRQMTWFRHQAKVEWIEIGPEDDPSEIGRRVLEHWDRYGATQIRA